MTPKPFCYVAGPYTKPDSVLNVRKAVEVADHLVSMGLVPFIPHLNHLWNMVSPKDYEFWMDYDLRWLSRCDLVYRITGESPGADREVDMAKKLLKPVFYTYGDVREWLKEDRL